MITKHISVFIIVLSSVSTGQTQAPPGAAIPWMTYEAQLALCVAVWEISLHQ